MSAVLVVVIVGVVIAAIAGATLHEGKPATPTAEPRRDPEPPPATWVPAELPGAIGRGEVEPGQLELEPAFPLLDQRTDDTAPDERGFLARLRAGVLLAFTVVLLGSLAAGCIGGAAYLGAHALNQALK